MKQPSSDRLTRLLQGARHFREHVLPRHGEKLAHLAHGQDPGALFITCADSRVVPNLITQSEPGELFVCRNIGNIVPPHGQEQGVAAVVEYAVTALNVSDIVVCGHSDCGAMKALCDSHATDHLPAVRDWLRNAETVPGLVQAKHGDLPREQLVQALVEQNVLLQLQHLRTHPAVATRLASGGLALHGWVYGVGDGRIDVLDEATGTFMPVEQAADRLTRRA